MSKPTACTICLGYDASAPVSHPWETAPCYPDGIQLGAAPLLYCASGCQTLGLTNASDTPQTSGGGNDCGWGNPECKYCYGPMSVGGTTPEGCEATGYVWDRWFCPSACNVYPAPSFDDPVSCPGSSAAHELVGIIVGQVNEIMPKISSVAVGSCNSSTGAPNPPAGGCDAPCALPARRARFSCDYDMGFKTCNIGYCGTVDDIRFACIGPIAASCSLGNGARNVFLRGVGGLGSARITSTANVFFRDTDQTQIQFDAGIDVSLNFAVDLDMRILGLWYNSILSSAKPIGPFAVRIDAKDVTMSLDPATGWFSPSSFGIGSMVINTSYLDVENALDQAITSRIPGNTIISDIINGVIHNKWPSLMASAAGIVQPLLVKLIQKYFPGNIGIGVAPLSVTPCGTLTSDCGKLPLKGLLGIFGGLLVDAVQGINATLNKNWPQGGVAVSFSPSRYLKGKLVVGTLAPPVITGLGFDASSTLFRKSRSENLCAVDVAVDASFSVPGATIDLNTLAYTADSVVCSNIRIGATLVQVGTGVAVCSVGISPTATTHWAASGGTDAALFEWYLNHASAMYLSLVNKAISDQLISSGALGVPLSGVTWPALLQCSTCAPN